MTDESGNSEWSAALKDLELRSRIRWNESLKRFNTWRIGGPSRCLIDVETEEDLAKLLPFIKKKWNSMVPDRKRIQPADS